MVLMRKISRKYYQHIMKSQKIDSFLQKKVMMKKIALISALLISVSSFAQVGNILLRKTGSILKNKNENNSDTTQKEAKTEEKTETNANPWAAKLGGKADAQSEYIFNSNVLVELQNYKKDGSTKDDPSKIRYHFSDKEYYGTEMVMTDKKGKVTESIGVSEFSKNQIVSLINDDGEKTGTVMKIDLQKQIDKHSDTAGVKVTKTGKTKTILTYNCEEYIITDKDGNKTESWMTTGLPFDMKKMTAGARGNSSNYGEYGNGFMMEMTMTQKNGEKTTWKVLEVNLSNTKKIVTAEYKFPF